FFVCKRKPPLESKEVRFELQQVSWSAATAWTCRVFLCCKWPIRFLQSSSRQLKNRLMARASQSSNQTNIQTLTIPLLSAEQAKKSIQGAENRVWNSVLAGYLLVIIGTSNRPDQIIFNRRLESFKGIIEATAAEKVAEQGFHFDGSCSASCCHCGFRVEKLTDRLEQWKPLHQPNCELLQLLQLIDKKPPNAEIAADAKKHEKLIGQLLSALFDPIVGYVKSYGFSEGDVVLALLKLILKQAAGSGLKLPKSGDLIKVIHGIPDALRTLGAWTADLVKAAASWCVTTPAQNERINCLR
uniref:MYND-type domain-containing protein n=1 Tax=Macrostomum lignano TaxID=282301 RepID=A0A1I8HEN6_9PLAT